MIENTTAFNVEFHQDYRNGADEGLRCPVDNAGIRSTGDRPLALASDSPDWSKGSINKCVKYIADFQGVTIDPADALDYSSGKMNINQLSKYAHPSFMYGVNRDARNKRGGDMMSFRGYPTCQISSVQYEFIELNQMTAWTVKPFVQSFTYTRNTQNGQTTYDTRNLPVLYNADYISISGYVDLAEPYPLDVVYVGLSQEVEIQELDSFGNFLPMYSGSVIDPNFDAKTACYNSGNNTRFYFRLVAEREYGALYDGSTIDRTIDIKLDNYSFKEYQNHPFYGAPNLSTNLITRLNATWNGSRYIGHSGFVVDNEAPTQPTITSFANVTNGFNVVWTGSTDNVAVGGYYVYYKKDSGRAYLKADAGLNTSLNITAQDGYTYVFHVVAYDLAGNESTFEADKSLFIVSPLNLPICYIGSEFSQQLDVCQGMSPNTIVYSSEYTTIMYGGGGRIFSDSNGLIPFVGAYYWYGFSSIPNSNSFVAIRINNTGDVIGFYRC